MIERAGPARLCHSRAPADSLLSSLLFLPVDPRMLPRRRFSKGNAPIGRFPRCIHHRKTPDLMLDVAVCDLARLPGEEANEEAHVPRDCIRLLLILSILGIAAADPPKSRPHSVSILEFGAIGDGKTVNTIAFQNAIFYLKSFADKGGAQLYVPQGRWLTGSFNLTSHLTLFLEKNAVILGSQDPLAWPVIEPLPSYGQGLDLPGGRHRSLINGHNLRDVVVTGQNGSIDGQGSVWWDWVSSGSLNFSRPHLLELVNCDDVTISNLTLLNSPSWHVHPVYSSRVRVHNLTIYSPPENSVTDGIVPDSSSSVYIEDCEITVSHDAIALKSGWDEYGLTYGQPVKDVHISRVKLRTAVGSAIAIGSEMSGGVVDIHVNDISIADSASGVQIKTTLGRGSYVKDVVIKGVDLVNVHTAIVFSGQCGTHPDDHFNPDAIPAVHRVTLKSIVGEGIHLAGDLRGIDEDHVFSEICLSDISLSVSSQVPWICSNVLGSSHSVHPDPCPELKAQNLNSSDICYSLSTLIPSTFVQ